MMADNSVPGHHDDASGIPLVSYFFVGVGKCGTSWVYSFLEGSGLVSVPTIKEPYLIDRSPEDREAAIRKLYPEKSLPLADFSNVYYWDPENAEKIARYNPDARIVFTVRKPSERAASHFRFLLRNGMVKTDEFQKYADDGDEHEVVRRSDFEPLIRRYLDVFGRSQVLVLPLELLAADPGEYVSRLGSFLGRDLGEVSESQSKPVLAAAAPRNRRIAYLAWRFGQLLRRWDLLTWLARLRSSSLVQRVLFREAGNGAPIREAAASHVRLKTLDENYQDLLHRHCSPQWTQT